MKNKWLMAVLLAGVLAFNGGCALFLVGGAAAAGAGTVAYVNGELKETEGVAYDTAYDATLAAMNDLQYAVTDKSKGPLTTKILARTSGDKKIQVTLEKQSATVTDICIRVGTFGDESLSRQILDKIKSHF
jgi:Protein of unknown function (DUF3568)